MFEEIDARRERLKKYMPLDPGVERRIYAALDPLFIYNSNALEGNTLSLADTIYFIKERLLPGGKKEEEILEIKGQQAAIAYLREAARSRFELSEKLIREFHQLLTEQLSSDKYEPGRYKSRDNMVRLEDGTIFPYVSAAETGSAMHDLLAWYRSSDKTMQPIELAAQFHYRFILIHPFLDGNGRTARLLTNLILLLHDYPLGVIIRADSHRERYVGALRAVDTSVPLADLRPNHPGLNFFPFVNFVAQEVLWLFDYAIEMIESPTIVTEQDLITRFQRMERAALGAAGIALDESGRQRALAEAVKEATSRLDGLLRPMLDKANSGLRDLSIFVQSNTEPLVNLLPPVSPRTPVVERVTHNKSGMGGLISATLHRKQESLSGLDLPWNRFEVLVAAEPHRLNIWTILMSEIEHGNTMNAGALEDWSAHMTIPIESELFRSTEVTSFLLKELGRFLNIVDRELQRRQAKANSSSSQ